MKKEEILNIKENEDYYQTYLCIFYIAASLLTFILDIRAALSRDGMPAFFLTILLCIFVDNLLLSLKILISEESIKSERCDHCDSHNKG